MTGEEWPLPAMATFHARFSVVLHRAGIFFSKLVPSPRGPRQPGQFSAHNENETNENKATKRMAKV
jgi:hypothetical protein